MKLNIDPEWLKTMADKEDNKCISVAGGAPNASPAPLTDGDLAEFTKLLEWHKAFHEAERDKDIGAVGRRVLDAVHEGFPGLIQRLRAAEADAGRYMGQALHNLGAAEELREDRDRLREHLEAIKLDCESGLRILECPPDDWINTINRVVFRAADALEPKEADGE